MIEKEIKILDINYTELTKELESLGAKKKNACLIRDWYFDYDDKRFRKEGFRAKLRAYGTHQFELTIKEKVESEKTKNRIERHISLESIESGCLLFASLGLTEQWKKEKIRVSYTIDDVIFDIDFYDGIPPLLEIEGPDSDTIFERVERLGLRKHKVKKRGTKKLFRYYEKKIS